MGKEFMYKRLQRQYLLFIFLLAGIAIGLPSTVLATTVSNSENYQMTESRFGTQSTQTSCSGQYCAKTSIGNMATGGGGNERGSATFGSVVDGEPLLEVIVEEGEANLGVLTTEATASKTSLIKVRNYLSDGYIIQVVGKSPKYGDYFLKTPVSPAASIPGMEQFGINLVANTSPNIGSNPQQVPSTSTSFGIVDEAYATPNRFKYSDGDIVAKSTSESGQTIYTLSMIVNISNLTPAGHFAGDFAAIVTPLY